MDRGAWWALVHGGHKESDITEMTWHAHTGCGASQVMPVVRNPTASARDPRDAGSILIDMHSQAVQSRSSYFHVSDILSSVGLRFLQRIRKNHFWSQGTRLPVPVRSLNCCPV